jgi:hypothetical protein
LHCSMFIFDRFICCTVLCFAALVNGLASVKIPLSNIGSHWTANISVSNLVKGSATSVPLILDTKLGPTLVFSSQFCIAAARQGFAPPNSGCAPFAAAGSEFLNFDVIADNTRVQAHCSDAQIRAAFSDSAIFQESICCVTGKSETVGFSSVSSVSYWNLTVGSLGLAPAARLPHASSEFINQHLIDLPILSLDLNIGSDSWLSLGVTPVPAITWSQYFAAPVYATPLLQAAHDGFDPMQLGIFSLFICGVSMFDNATGYMTAIVDTGSSCLGLPPSLYSAFLSWTSFWVMKDGFLFVRDDVPLQRLPALSFSIDNLVNSSSQSFHIPLSSLILGNRRLCVEPLFAPTSIKWPPIIFGALVVANFHFSFDYQLRLSGLAPKLAQQVALETFCAPEAVCWGQESFDESRNTCVSPYCSARLFFRFDPIMRQCVMSVPLLSLLACLVIFIVASELLLERWRSRVCARV